MPPIWAAPALSGISTSFINSFPLFFRDEIIAAMLCTLLFSAVPEVRDTGEIQKVTMKDEAEPEETPETPDTPATTVDAPKTGDHTPIAALMISCGLGLAGVIAAAVWMKVRKKKRD